MLSEDGRQWHFSAGFSCQKYISWGKKKSLSYSVPLAFFSLTSAKVQHILPRVAWDGWDSEGSNILSLWSQAFITNTSPPIPADPSEQSLGLEFSILMCDFSWAKHEGHWSILEAYTFLSIKNLPISSLWAVWSRASVSLRARMALNASSVFCVPLFWALECGNLLQGCLVCLKTLGGTPDSSGSSFCGVWVGISRWVLSIKKIFVFFNKND